MKTKFRKLMIMDVSPATTRWSLTLALFVYLLLVTFISVAKPMVPAPNSVVASWPEEASRSTTGASISQVTWHVQQGQYPGKANMHYAQAQKMLDGMTETQSNNADTHYLHARLLQYQHRFDEAQEQLTHLLDIAPTHLSGLLLKANLHLVNNEIEPALNTCKRLVGTADLTLATACSLEAASYQPNKLQSSYAVLSNLLSNMGLGKVEVGASENNETNVWLKQIAADMALRLDEVDQAARWITDDNLDNQPLSYVVLWADIQHLLGNHAQVIRKLGQIVEQSDFKDDSLLIRLAIAEKALETPAANTQWRQLAKQRIDLRVARNDDFHAADIGRYYLFVDLQPQLALTWAKHNFDHAKLHDDQLLLEQAQFLALQQGI